jgi:hypothetical protein
MLSSSARRRDLTDIVYNPIMAKLEKMDVKLNELNTDFLAGIRNIDVKILKIKEKTDNLQAGVFMNPQAGVVAQPNLSQPQTRNTDMDTDYLRLFYKDRHEKEMAKREGKQIGGLKRDKKKTTRRKNNKKKKQQKNKTTKK